MTSDPISGKMGTRTVLNVPLDAEHLGCEPGAHVADRLVQPHLHVVAAGPVDSGVALGMPSGSILPQKSMMLTL